MKENDKLKELTLEELYAKQKKFKIIGYIIGTLMVISLLVFFYSLIKNEKHSQYFFIGSFTAILGFSASQLKKIEEEIKSRNSQS
jgi:uncharacterized BrkB/YihY/UPF0761 family membrane protein